MTQVLSFFFQCEELDQSSETENAEEKQTGAQSAAVNSIHFLPHTGLEKITNNWFRTNIPFMHQISSSFILLGSKIKKKPTQHPDRQIRTNVLTRYLWYNSMLKTSVQPDTVPACKTQLRLHSLMTVMSRSKKGNVHLYKALEVIKIQFKTKGDRK